MLSRIFATGGVLSLGLWAGVALSNPGQGAASHVSPGLRPTPTPRPDQTARVEGRVLDARLKTPIAGAQVTISGHDDLLETTTGRDGIYKFPHVTPDDYAWKVEAPGYSGRSDDDSTPISVPAKGRMFDIRLIPQGRVAGQVRDQAGRPVGGAHVQVVDVDEEGDDNEIVATDRNGHFEVRSLNVPFGPGSVVLSVTAFDPRLSQCQAKVKVKPFLRAGDETHVAFTMLPRAVITGRLTRRGQPLTTALAWVDKEEGVGFDSDNPNYVLPHSIVATDKNGRFRLLVSAPETFNLSLSAEDAVDQQVAVRVRPGQTVVVNRELKHFPFGSIRGRLLNLAGRPVGGAGIQLWTKGNSDGGYTTSTDNTGYFFDQVPPDSKYNLTVVLPDAQGNGGTGEKKWSPVRVRLGRTTRVQLRIDNVPPTFELLAPVPRVLNGAVEWRVRARDNGGLSSASLSVDGGQMDFEHQIMDKRFPGATAPRVGDLTLSWNSRGALNGRHRIHIEVSDVVGNLAERDFAVWVRGSPIAKATPLPDLGDSLGNTVADTRNGVSGY